MRRTYVTALVIVACLVGGFSLEATANNIQVTNVLLTGLDVASSNILINFDVTWENSWRDGVNWDAAWVFAKWGLPGGATTNWSNCVIMTTGHVAPSGCTIKNSDAAGAFVYRSAEGRGTVDYTVRLRWDYGASGLDLTNPVAISVHAIEMVYVAGGAHDVGGTDVSTARFHRSDNSATPYRIVDEGPINWNSTPSLDLYATGNPRLSSDTIPAAFPKGFNAFYCMKYEISQEQYAAFLNEITTNAATARWHSVIENGYTIGGTWPNHVASSPDRACNYVIFEDLLAYLDWSGLRPMSEFEFEKSCLGPEDEIPPTLDRIYIWGDYSDAETADYTLANSGDPDEVIANGRIGYGNMLNSVTAGITGNRPYRCGIFAASYVDPTRKEAGASYWGAMELCGNVIEFTVAAGYTNGFDNFDGSHGDGSIDPITGDPNVAGWPDANNSLSFAARGGDMTRNQNTSTVKNRTSAGQGWAFDNRTTEGRYCGGRGVRTAP